MNGQYTDRYIFDGTRVVGMERTKNGSSVKDVYHFMYDEMGNIWSAICYVGGSTSPIRYYYRTNAQGDVKQIVDSDSNVIAYYAYDAWGRPLAILDGNDKTITDTSHFAIVNPFRYRGYIYDNETGFYCLQSRYYDPEIGRFVNADGYIYTGQSEYGYNMYAYCNNNPVMYDDASGHASRWVLDGVEYCYDGSKSDFINLNLGLPPKAYQEAYDKKESSFYEKYKDKDGSIALYDNHRENPDSVYHEQWLAVQGTEPTLSLLDGTATFGSIKGTIVTGGWETEYVDISLFDFGSAEPTCGIENFTLNFTAMAAAWSPSITVSVWDYEITVEFYFVAAGVKYVSGEKGYHIGGAAIVGAGLSIVNKN